MDRELSSDGKMAINAVAGQGQKQGEQGLSVKERLMLIRDRAIAKARSNIKANRTGGDVKKENSSVQANVISSPVKERLRRLREKLAKNQSVCAAPTVTAEVNEVAEKRATQESLDRVDDKAAVSDHEKTGAPVAVDENAGAPVVVDENAGTPAVAVDENAETTSPDDENARALVADEVVASDDETTASAFESALEESNDGDNETLHRKNVEVQGTLDDSNVETEAKRFEKTVLRSGLHEFNSEQCAWKDKEEDLQVAKQALTQVHMDLKEKFAQSAYERYETLKQACKSEIKLLEIKYKGEINELQCQRKHDENELHKLGESLRILQEEQQNGIKTADALRQEQKVSQKLKLALKAQARELERERKQHRQELEKLEQEHEKETSVASKLRQQREEISQMRIADLESKQSDTKHQHALEIKQLRETLRTHDTESKKTQADLEKQVRLAQTNFREMERLKQTSAEEMSKTNNDLSAKVVELKQALEEKEVKVKSQAGLLQSSQKEIDELQLHIKELQETLIASQAERRHLKNDLEDLQKQRSDDEHENITNLKKQLHESQATSRSLKNALRVQQEDVEEWKRVTEEGFNAKLEQQIRKYSEELEDLRNQWRAQIQDHEIQNTHLAQANEIVTQLNQSLREEVTNRDQHLVKLNALLENCKAAFQREREEYEGQVNELKVNLMVAKGQADRADEFESKANRLELEVIQLKSDLRQVQHELHDTNVFVAMQKELVEEREKENEENRNAISDLKSKVGPIEDELRRAKDDLENCKHFVDESIKTIRNLDTVNGSLKAELYKMRSIANAFEKQANELHEVNSNLEGRVQTYQHEIKNLKRARNDDMFLNPPRVSPRKASTKATLKVSIAPSSQSIINPAEQRHNVLPNTPKSNTITKKVVKKRRTKPLSKSPRTARTTDRRANMPQACIRNQQETRRHIQNRLEKAPWR